MEKDTDEIPNETLYDKLPIQIANILERRIELLDILLSLNESNFEEKSRIILDSEFYDKIEMYEVFICISLNVCFFWPKKIPFITQLFNIIHKKDKGSNSIVTKRIILNQVFHGYFNNPRDDVYVFYLYLLWYGFQYHDIPRSELVNDIKQSYFRKRQFTNQLCMIFLYFAPEIEEEDLDFYIEIKKYVELCREKNLLCPKTLKFLNNFEYYRENNWEMLIKNRMNFDCDDPLLRSMMNDDLELFKKTLSLDDYSNDEAHIKTVLNRYFENPPLSLFTLFDVKFPLISVAAAFAAKNIFTYMYENGASLDQTAENGATVVQLASMCPMEEIISILQKENYDLSEGMASIVRCFDISKVKKYFPLYLGLNYDDIFSNQEKESYIFKYVMSPTKSTVLVQSVLTTNYILLKVCLQNKLIDINEPDGDGLTPLDASCQMGKKLVVEILVELGADLSLGSPLVNAAMCGHSDIVKFLLSILDSGDDCDKKDDEVIHDDDYLFQYSHYQCYNQDIKIPNDLINKANSKGITPLYASITNSHYKVTRILLMNKKTDLNRRFKDGSTYINLAASQNNTDILNIVLEYVKIPFEDHDVSPLASAIISGMINSFQFLLEKKRDQIDLNKMFKSADVSALWIAVKFSNPEIVTYLIEKENCEVTAMEIDLATRNDDKNILEILNKYYNVNDNENNNNDSSTDSNSNNNNNANDNDHGDLNEYEEESGTEAIADDFQDHDEKPDLI